ncbi:MAG: glycosyltransferase family 4 protein [Ruminococcus sp.]|nr:glycosyltransferase family 4 protein [Ruminococcus sp.]
MRILYGYSNCTDKTFQKIFNERKVAELLPDQKYHSLLIRGLSENGAKIYCFSGLPVNRAVTSRKLVREKDEREGKAYFHYITTLNFPVIRQLMIFFGTFFGVLTAKKDSDTFAMCDCLNLSNAYGMTLAARIRRIPVVSIVTDLPVMQRKSRFATFVNNLLFKMSDAFVILTAMMNQKVNQKNKPSIVLEGHVDSMAPTPEIRKPYEVTEGIKTLLYAGSLKRIYGIDYLVRGFVKADIPDAQLRVYGDGDFKEELLRLCEMYPSVKYMGVRDNAHIVEEEQKASLLINPRPIAPEYTKYSFPSKNMEYMVSGTPLLTTGLPGMPEEYYPYVYIMGEETPDNAAKVIKKILDTPLSDRQKKGMAAREFVLQNKSNVIQAKKILEFLDYSVRKNNGT